MNKDIFNTPEEEIKRLAEEIKGLKEAAQDVLRSLTRIETRMQRVFPSQYPKRASSKKERVSIHDKRPTLTPEQALQLYDELVQQARGDDTHLIKERLASLSIADLSVLRQELGISIGKKKPSRKALTDSVMGRINESIMLSKHLNRAEIVSRSSNPEDTHKNNENTKV
jgi:hypothetical protein